MIFKIFFQVIHIMFSMFRGLKYYLSSKYDYLSTWTKGVFLLLNIKLMGMNGYFLYNFQVYKQ